MKYSSTYHRMAPLLIVTFLSLYTKLFAQEYTIDNIRSKMIIKGTTNFKDWELHVEEHKGNIVLENNGNRVLSSLFVEIPVRSLKGGKKGMEKDAYQAMKAEEHPSVTFTLTTPVVLETSVDNTYSITALGDLSISGITKSTELEFTLTRTTNGVDLEGEKIIDMTDYGIEPPRAFLGILKVEKEVSLKFTTTFLK